MLDWVSPKRVFFQNTDSMSCMKLRLYVPNLKKDEAECVLEEESLHIIHQVMRKKTGESLILMNGQGLIAQATLQEITKKNARVHVEQMQEFSPPKMNLVLLQAMVKSDKTEWIVQKATELGTQKVIFFQAHHSVKEGSSKWLDRLNKIAIEAMRQCGNPFLPHISIEKNIMPNLPDFQGYKKLFCNETEGKNNLHTQLTPDLAKGCVVAIGPEGGWSDAEKLFFIKESFVSVSLGQLVLRSDTASVVALGVVKTWMEFYGK